jgi:hypothetical protein
MSLIKAQSLLDDGLVNVQLAVSITETLLGTHCCLLDIYIWIWTSNVVFANLTGPSLSNYTFARSLAELSRNFCKNIPTNQIWVRWWFIISVQLREAVSKQNFGFMFANSQNSFREGLKQNLSGLRNHDSLRGPLDQSPYTNILFVCTGSNAENRPTSASWSVC